MLEQYISRGSHLNLVASSCVCVEARSCSSVGSNLAGAAAVTGPTPAGRVVLGVGLGAEGVAEDVAAVVGTGRLATPAPQAVLLLSLCALDAHSLNSVVGRNIEVRFVKTEQLNSSGSRAQRQASRRQLCCEQNR